MMEQWKKQFQEMIETDPGEAMRFVKSYFFYLDKLDMPSIKTFISGIVSRLRIQHPSAYHEFAEIVNLRHGRMVQEQEKRNHQGHIIQFNQGGK